MLFQNLLAALNVCLGAFWIGKSCDVKKGVALVSGRFAIHPDDDSFEITGYGGLMSTKGIADEAKLGPGSDRIP